MSPLWRWLPLAVSLAWMAVAVRLPLADAAASEEAIEHRAASVVFSVLWVLVAAFLAVSRRHRILSRNVRALSPGVALIAGSILFALGVLAWQARTSWSWLPLILLLLHVGLSAGQPRFAVAACLLAVLFPASIMEAALYELRTTPSLAAHAAFEAVARHLYYLDRSVIQVEPDCGRFDPELFYTLRPGGCVFENTEFRNEIRVNSLGVRDDEASLDAPDVVVVGDSTSMGWGVMEQQDYPALLEQLTHLRVLNTGVSSFATNREMKMLARVDRSHMRWLLLQYCENDASENEYYRLEHDNPPPYMESEYNGAVRTSQIEQRYYPGRYLTFMLDESFIHLGQSLGVHWPPPPDLTPAPPFHQEMSNLLRVIETTPLDLSGVEILVYELPEKEYRRNGFTRELADALKEHAGRPNIDHVTPVDALAMMPPSDFRILDGHLNASGHKRVAEILAKVILYGPSAPR